MVIPAGSTLCLTEGQYANRVGVILHGDQGVYEVWLDRLRFITHVDEGSFVVLALRYVDDYLLLF
jgi:hypothetical protein